MKSGGEASISWTRDGGVQRGRESAGGCRECSVSGRVSQCRRSQGSGGGRAGVSGWLQAFSGRRRSRSSPNTRRPMTPRPGACMRRLLESAAYAPRDGKPPLNLQPPAAVHSPSQDFAQQQVPTLSAFPTPLYPCTRELCTHVSPSYRDWHDSPAWPHPYNQTCCHASPSARFPLTIPLTDRRLATRCKLNNSVIILSSLAMQPSARS